MFFTHVHSPLISTGKANHHDGICQQGKTSNPGGTVLELPQNCGSVTSWYNNIVEAPNSKSRCDVESTVAGNSPLSLLYVEDEPTARDVVCTFVRKIFPDIQLYTAGNGKEGLERFKDLRPDIVVTDIIMPSMNGIEMARAIKALDCATQIVVTSAHCDMEYFIDSIEIGVNRYVMKPIDRDKLIESIKGQVSTRYIISFSLNVRG
jgi:CheY-like chemotaxis protein